MISFRFTSFPGILMRNCIISGRELEDEDIIVELENRPGHWVLLSELLN